MIVLEGDGGQAFVSGADISQFEGRRGDDQASQRFGAAVAEAYAAPIKCSKPVVAKIGGICMGGGLGLAAACDLRFCLEDARFRMPASRLGIGYSVDGVDRFVSVIGVQNTLDIFYSARIFDAADALQMGFVSKVAPRETFDQLVDDWCAMVAGNAPLVLRAAKMTVNHLIPEPKADDLDTLNAAISACMVSRDHIEGVNAFAEKRSPNFAGR